MRHLKKLNQVICLSLCLFVFSCSSDDDDKNKNGITSSGKGLCVSSCPKSCNIDNDCDTANGELCCNYGTEGKSCTIAKNCPRFCSDDQICDTISGEACLRTTLVSDKKVCIAPKYSIKLCSDDSVCDTAKEEKCCDVYKEPICLPSKSCPKGCSTSNECDSANDEICCTTMDTKDKTLNVAGLCIDPDYVNCPKACTQSSECDNKKGELCCFGTCQTSCPKECSASNECVDKLCCKNTVILSPWFSASEKQGASSTQDDGGSYSSNKKDVIENSTDSSDLVYDFCDKSLWTNKPCSNWDCVLDDCCSELKACGQKSFQPSMECSDFKECADWYCECYPSFL